VKVPSAVQEGGKEENADQRKRGNPGQTDGRNPSFVFKCERRIQVRVSLIIGKQDCGAVPQQLKYITVQILTANGA
jgi:hypothetical protein